MIRNQSGSVVQFSKKITPKKLKQALLENKMEARERANANKKSWTDKQLGLMFENR